MPSVSTKSEIKPVFDGLEPIKQALLCVEKKLRNLEKRKGKLDGYRAKHDSGEILNEDQKDAISKYDSVLLNLEFARELQKQFQTINVDAEKAQKKQAKRDKASGQAQEVKKISQLLRFQDVFNNMDGESVRTDFKEGKNGAVLLTEDNLKELDEMYKLINPTREGETSFEAELSAASEHIASLLEGKERPVIGTTYKDLKAMVQNIASCGYFNSMPSTQGEPSTKNEVEADDDSSGSEEYVTAKSEDMADSQTTEVPTSLGADQTELEAPSERVNNAAVTRNTEQSLIDNTFFSQQTQQAPGEDPAVVAYDNKRDIKAIVSSVQGSFNFLQESQIDDSPHMDPAVVAAHPMVPQIPGTTDTANMIPRGYNGTPPVGLLDDQNSQTNAQPPMSSQTFYQGGAPQNDYSRTTQQQADYGATQKAAGYVTSQQQGGGYGAYQDASYVTQGLKGNTFSQNVPEVPPAIPLPNEGHNDERENGSEDQGPGFAMNANAAIFRSSVYTNSSVSNEDETQAAQTTDQPAANENGPTTAFDPNYNRFNNSRGARGGRGSRGGSGFRGNRGGVNGGYNAARGGYNNRGTSRGGTYQGYAPRDNYKPDGYQGMNGTGGGLNNRGRGVGGARGAGRGGPRGGTGNTRGANRGGMNRANFNTPNQQQSQTA